MNFDIIFLAGVHGVGKGYVAEYLSSALSMHVFSASSLIKQQKNAPVDHQKKVIDADKNQDHLIEALNMLSIKDEAIILDGHFCLSSTTGIIDIPMLTFQSMTLKAVVLLTAEPELIHQRLLARDGSAMTADEIYNLQNREIDYAKKVSNSLDVPLLMAGQGDLASISNWISTHLTKI
jgi:adenylate kinase